MTETRKKIKGYDNYEVSDQGNVYNIKTGKKLSAVENYNGYKTVSLSNNGNVKTYAIHKLVMFTFNPIPNADLMFVGHKDGNNNNNCLDNLYYATPTDRRKIKPIPRDIKKLENMILDAVRNTINKYTYEIEAETAALEQVKKHVEFR